MAQLRSEVLSLYRKVLRISRAWQSKEAQDTVSDRRYVVKEARELIEHNRSLTDDTVIRERLKEGHARIDLALHYRNPYPRPVNLPQSQLPPGKSKLKRRDKIVEMSKPIYIKSYEDRKSEDKDSANF